MIFTGNPGTGKTTIAKLVGKILREFGVLKTGRILEVRGREELVAGYENMTVKKTKDKINEAKGGVLFVDEA